MTIALLERSCWSADAAVCDPVAVAWCDECDRYLTPSSLEADGTCPTCESGAVLVDLSPPPRAPWHFKLLVGLAGAYLLWRAVFGLIWLVGRLL